MNDKSIFPFNELSLHDLDSSKFIEDYFNRIISFSKIIKNTQKLNIAYPSCILKDVCKDGQKLIDHIVKSKLDKDSQGILLSSIQEVPFLDEFLENTIEHEFHFQGRKAIGGAYAYHLESALFSIPSAEHWNSHQVEMQKCILDKNADLITTNIDILNVGSLDNIDNSWIKKIIPEVNIDSPDKLFEITRKDYSCIVLSDCTTEYIKRLGSLTSRLNKINEAFQCLQEYCSKVWSFGALNRTHIIDMGLRLKNESDPTMEKYGSERNFKNENGISQQYRFHFNISEGDRAYIGEINGDRKIYIAYMGPHLRTVNFD